jgi:hypothetical protein
VDDNLIVLCHNCHHLTHWYSVGRRAESHGHERNPPALARQQWATIRDLALRIRARAEAVAAKDRRLFAAGATAGGSVTIEDALQRIALRNGFEGSERKTMFAVVQLLLRKMPPAIREQASVRLLLQQSASRSIEAVRN